MKPIWICLFLCIGFLRTEAVPVRPGIVQEFHGSNGPALKILRGDERGYSWQSVSSAESIRPQAVRSTPRPVDYSPAAHIPVTGTVPVYVLAVHFPDLEAPSPLSEIINNVSAEAGGYFADVSRGVLDLEFIPLADEWIEVDSTYQYFGSDGSGVDDANGEIFELTRLALMTADDLVDFSSLDTNDNGQFDAGEFHLLIIHAGEDQAFTGYSSDIWSHRWWVYGEAQGYEDTFLDGVLITESGIAGDERSPGYTMVAWNDRLGVICHELLHSFGAPDLYDVGGNPETPVGYWSLMDIGVWLGTPQGSAPCRPGGYLEWDIDADPSNGMNGWMTPLSIQDGGYGVSRLGSGSGTELYLVETPVSGEYFVIENRIQYGVDQAIPESGILICHIDESQPVNNIESNPPYRVWLEDPGIRGYKRGAAYSSDDGPEQSAFTPETDPGTQTNRGFETGVSITAVSEESEVMNFVLSGLGGPGIPDEFLVFPTRIHPGGTVTAVLPETGGKNGSIGLYNLQGRSLSRHTVAPGALAYVVDIPAWTGSGLYFVVYSSSTVRHSTHVVIVPDEEG